MKPLSRSPVNKRRSAGQFRANGKTTASANMAPPPMRGGFRL